ncbi:MAG: translation initiation factor IF-2 N-terminal domain-containing protein, partial [Pseudomonadota bacterium]
MVRVYELAHELGMTNNDFIVELENLGIEVKGHMSSIDEGDIGRIRNRLAAASNQEVIEKRVKPTVIRRRLKKVKPEIKPEAEPMEAGPVKAELVEIEGPVVEGQEQEEVSPPSFAVEEGVKETEEPVSEIATEAKEEAAKLLVEKRPVKEVLTTEVVEERAKVRHGKERIKEDVETLVAQKPSKRKVIYKKLDEEQRGTYEGEDV